MKMWVEVVSKWAVVMHGDEKQMLRKVGCKREKKKNERRNEYGWVPLGCGRKTDGEDDELR